MKLIPFFLLIAFLSYAQDYSVEILKPQKGKTQGADYIGLDNNGNLYTASMKISGLIFVSEYLKVIDPASGRIISEVKLGNNKNLKKAGYDYVDIRVIRGELVLICKNKKSKVMFIIDGVDSNTASTVQGYISKIISNINENLKPQFRSNGKEIINYKPRIWYNPELKSQIFLVPGLIVYIQSKDKNIEISLNEIVFHKSSNINVPTNGENISFEQYVNYKEKEVSQFIKKLKSKLPRGAKVTVNETGDSYNLEKEYY